MTSDEAKRPILSTTITAIIANDLHLPFSERHRIGPAVERIMEAVAASTSPPVTVEQIAPYCPGDRFPFDKLTNMLNEAEADEARANICRHNLTAIRDAVAIASHRQSVAAPPLSIAKLRRIAGIIECHEELSDWPQAAREIAALYGAPLVPAEIMRDLPNGEFVETYAAGFPDDLIVGPPITAANTRAIGKLIRWAFSLPTAAPDAAVELAKRLPSAQALDDFTAFSSDFISPAMKKYRQPLADAAAYVRRAAGEVT